MGLVFVDAEVEGRPGKRRPVRFLVDSGASYSVLPGRVWRAIGLKPKRTMVFTLADGTQLRRKVSECLVRLEGQEGHTPVVLGEGADEALLGVVTLENLGLVLNPFDRTLRPMRAMLAGTSASRRRGPGAGRWTTSG
jgi:clan AA aspartic protease